MRTEDLRRLEDSVLTVSNRLDAVLEDYFAIDGTVAPAKDVKSICKKLTNAFGEIDEALDEIKSLIKEPTRLGDQTDPDEAVPVLSEEDFRAMLRSLKPEVAEKDLKAAKEIFSWANEIKNLDTDLIPTFAAMMLIEYGKQAGKKKLVQASDPDGRIKWDDKIPW